MQENPISEIIPIKHYICQRCEHKWIPYLEDRPRVCPKCKSPYWDRPRKINNSNGENNKL